MSVTIRHTKSTSGRTHRLTVTTKRFFGNRAVFDVKPQVETRVVTKRYASAPQFDDQVQGDLIRQYWLDGGNVQPIGVVGGGVATVDPDLDAEELEATRPSPRQIAEACFNAIGKPESLTPDQFIGGIMTAVRKDRELYR